MWPLAVGALDRDGLLLLLPLPAHLCAVALPAQPALGLFRRTRCGNVAEPHATVALVRLLVVRFGRE